MSLELVRQYHTNLPEGIRQYLRDVRGISDDAINHHLLGWDGRRITIPIFNRSGLFSFFKLAKDPEDASDTPKMLAPPGSHAELYGWERLAFAPEQIVICEGEFDRLVLESRGLAAVTSTGGAQVFRAEWAEAFKEIPHVYVAFDSDSAGRAGAERVARLIPQARLVSWPAEVGEGGDVTDFLLRLGRTVEDFEQLLATAQTLPPEPPRPEPPTRPASTITEVQELKSLIRIEEVIGRYVQLRVSGQNFVGCCPLHEDGKPSFVVFPRTQSFYCFGCRAHGDVITFLMRQQGHTFRKAVEVLKQLVA